MNALFAAAADVLAFFVERGWRGCVIGGVAVQRWGEPRQTRDVALTLLTGLGGEEAFVDPILEHYGSTPFEVEPGASLAICSAEDLVILKAFADRPQDWLDIEGVIVRQRSALNRDLVIVNLRPLLELKEDMGAIGRLLVLFEKHRPQ